LAKIAVILPKPFRNAVEHELTRVVSLMWCGFEQNVLLFADRIAA
jgi:hypothetical protein